MKAYISIPISGRPLIDAKCQAERIKAKLTEHGHECITPFVFGRNQASLMPTTWAKTLRLC